MLMGGLLVERILGTPKLKMHLCVLQNIFSSRHNVFQSFIVDRKIYVKNQLGGCCCCSHDSLKLGLRCTRRLEVRILWSILDLKLYLMAWMVSARSVLDPIFLARVSFRCSRKVLGVVVRLNGYFFCWIEGSDVSFVLSFSS